jgi:hypothetical protein
MNECIAGKPFQPCLLRERTSIPVALLKDPTLSASARLLWGILAAYQGMDLECFPLEETLAVFLGVKVRQLQSYLKELKNYRRGDPPEAFPLLAVKRVWVMKDQNTRNTYSLLWQPFLVVSPKATRIKRAHLANSGSAQSLAYRFGGDSPKAQPVRPGIFSEDGVAIRAGIPPHDTQSSACLPRGDPQDAGAVCPSIPNADGRAVADGSAPGDPQDSASGPVPFPAETAPRYRTPWIPVKEPRTS